MNSKTYPLLLKVLSNNIICKCKCVNVLAGMSQTAPIKCIVMLSYSNRIVVYGEEMLDAIVPDSAKSFNFQVEFGLTDEEVCFIIISIFIL